MNILLSAWQSITKGPSGLGACTSNRDPVTVHEVGALAARHPLPNLNAT